MQYKGLNLNLPYKKYALCLQFKYFEIFDRNMYINYALLSDSVYLLNGHIQRTQIFWVKTHKFLFLYFLWDNEQVNLINLFYFIACCSTVVAKLFTVGFSHRMSITLQQCTFPATIVPLSLPPVSDVGILLLSHSLFLFSFSYCCLHYVNKGCCACHIFPFQHSILIQRDQF